MANVDVYVKIKYDAKKEKVSIGETNIKEERLEDFLLEWLHGQIGQGKDERKARKRRFYEVVVGCDLSFDAFHVQSNTRNDGLTCGIIMEAVRILGEKQK